MISGSMVKSFVAVLIPTLVMCHFVYQGHFKHATVELGPDHYAEQVHIAIKPYLPSWVKMPLNTLVNIGYVVVGAAWCAITTVALFGEAMKNSDSILFYVFNCGACCYGPIQALRILTQLHGFAVLDQWYTLPFFMWVFVWGIYFKYGWSLNRALALMCLSVASYVLVLYHNRGFEICLGVHIFLAILGAVTAWQKHPQAKAQVPFNLALICCLGFVVVKLIDLELPKYHVIFKYISGHFVSKIFDVCQLHFVNQFFLKITSAANNDKKKKKE